MTDRDSPLAFTPVVIIGAGRSGTNALRDALTALPEFLTWPCDEINPIWRHGNLDHPNDEIPPEKATPGVRRYIRNAFARIWRQQGRAPFVVEKTCANSLRVPFVDRVLPEARYIHIRRDGYDVVASAQKRWRGEFELPRLPYFLAKARYAPASDLPRYALSALRHRIAVRMGRRDHLGTWGPRFAGIEDHAGAPLEEIVARQWAACVGRSRAAFAEMPEGKVLDLAYEDFVQDPAPTLERITAWLGAPARSEEIATAAATVRRGSVGKGRALGGSLPPDIRTIIDRADAARSASE
ncbi:hypothetical protein OB2597_13048 [Pseudooceanicola batsensis HTCC2597]|uniref:Sulfotransferase n=1 Tax=Pseudooceanicola batsensis (strain ATCC BAA-863 / DSM 15984 / KCTC 12145 / HTCC2597) TaxID=252305 RepID=A3TY38_PSEBH|nr:sulfotransferase [Pseudooceanicola batsensis]EAQ03072.1 hypothetical protein OB2597_13048 [Pseudooceanicola batsensis HTCC2597]